MYNINIIKNERKKAMNEFLIRKMNIEFEEDKIRKDNVLLEDKILEKAKT